MCPRSKKVITGLDYERNVAVYLDTQCKTYECPVCRDCIRKIHQARIIYGTKEHAPWQGLRWSFVTLTSHEKVRDPAGSLRLMQLALPRWRKRMKRRYGDFDYVMVFERHASGAAHVHMLINCPVSKKHVRRHARAVGLGYMADVQALHAPAAAGKYVAKYLSKSLAEAEFPKRFKRVRYSRGWPDLPPRPSGAIRQWLAIDHSDVLLHIAADVECGRSVIVDDRLVPRVLSSDALIELDARRVKSSSKASR